MRISKLLSPPCGTTRPLSRKSTRCSPRTFLPREKPLYASSTARQALNRQALISPDVAMCADCEKELLDPSDRRFWYPFINCTNCGPRFTIIQDVPYDREKTTMQVFAMCPDCLAEYQNPRHRRFHAQPNACPSCGPSIRIATGATGDGLRRAAWQCQNPPFTGGAPIAGGADDCRQGSGRLSPGLRCLECPGGQPIAPAQAARGQTVCAVGV